MLQSIGEDKDDEIRYDLEHSIVSGANIQRECHHDYEKAGEENDKHEDADKVCSVLPNYARDTRPIRL